MIPDDNQTVLDALRLVDDYLGQIRRIERAARCLLASPDAYTRGNLKFELAELKRMNG